MLTLCAWSLCAWSLCACLCVAVELHRTLARARREAGACRAHTSPFAPFALRSIAVAAHIRNITEGFSSYHLMCHSQGGILCRSVLEIMDDHRIDNFISLAGVQQGVMGIPPKGWPSWAPKWLLNVSADVAYLVMYTDIAQDLVSFAGYWNDPRSIARPTFLQYDHYLPVVNNDPGAGSAGVPAFAGTAASRKANFLRLGAMHCFASPDDGVVVPWDSPLFATFDPTNLNRTIPMNATAAYQDDWFGLRSMHEAGKLTTTAVPNVPHTEWTESTDIFTTYLEPLLR